MSNDRELLPIDMVLHCPACGLQHIDTSVPNPDWCDGCNPENCEGCGSVVTGKWTNPPHRSHLCHGCGHIWRPADVATNGVATLKTKGKADSAAPPQREPLPAGFRLVPVEPTREFVKKVQNHGVWEEHEVRNLYADILAALGTAVAEPVASGEPAGMPPAPKACLSATPSAGRPDDACPEEWCSVLGQCRIGYKWGSAPAPAEDMAAAVAEPLTAESIEQAIGYRLPEYAMQALLGLIGTPPQRDRCWACGNTGSVTTSSNGSGLIEAPCAACAPKEQS